MKLRFTCLILTLFLFSVSSSLATTYYLSNSGNDSFSGTRADSAWQTLTKLNATTLQPGDSILFETGGVFRGQINLVNSGVAGQSIYFGPYGGGSVNPIISGCKLITRWSIYDGHIYIANVSDTVSNVFENKVMMTSARYPNKGFLTIDSSGVNTGLYDPRLNIHTDWSGARLKVRSSDNRYEDVPVDTSNGAWLILATPTANTLSAGYGYYLDHHLADLDTAGEWYYDTSSHSLFIYTASATDTSTVEASVFNYGLNAGNNNSFIKIYGIDFENQGKDGVLFSGSSENISFLNCNFRNCYLRGIHLDVSSNDTIDHCSFKNVMGDCLALGSLSNSVVSNNQLNHIGAIPGYGLDGFTQYNAISFSGNGNTISNNVMDTIGSSAVVFSGTNDLIDKNLIRSSLFTLNSSSAIMANNSTSSQSTISDNFIFNTIGNNLTTPRNPLFTNGISLSQSSYITINQNTVANTSGNGIYIESNNKHHSIQNNVVYNSGSAQLYFLDSDTLNGTSNNSSNNNIFYCLNETEHPMIIDGKDSLFHPGTFDLNYYCNPYDYYDAYHLYSDPLGGRHLLPLTLGLLMKQYNGDASSKSSLVKWEAYNYIDTIGDQIIENGNFTNNFDGWITNPTTNNELLLDNDNGLDGGSVKLIMLADTPAVYGQLQSSEFNNYTPNQLYRISFSGKAKKQVNVFNYTTNAVPGNVFKLAYQKFFPFDTSRTDFTHIYKETVTSTLTRIIFEITYPDSLIWLDNIHLYKVTASHNDSSKLSRLITNYSANTVSIALGDSIYHDLDGKLVQGNYTLQPYSSYVLTLDSPLFLITPFVPAPKNSLALFPNPINPCLQILHYDIQGISKDSKITLQLTDLCGRTVLTKTTYTNTGTIALPINISDGLYLFNAVSEKQYFEKKVLIFH